MSAKTLSISSMLAWWADGLRDAFPDLLSYVVFGSSSVLSFSCLTNRATLKLVSPKGVVELFDVALEEGRDKNTPHIEKSRSVRRAKSIQAAETVVRLAKSQVLTTRIELPARAALDLRAAILADLDRFTPFGTDDIYFDARIMSVNDEINRIKVILQVARKAEVDAAFALARSIGLRPTRVTGEEDPDALLLNLLPKDQQFRPSRFLPKLVKTMAGLFLGSIVLYAALIYARSIEAIDESETRIRQLRSSAVAASDMEARLSEFAAVVDSLENTKAAYPSATLALAEVTRALNDDTYLLGFEMQDATITISGFASDPAGMLPRLEDSDLLRNARFTAPTTRDGRTGLNRFIVKVELLGAPQ